MKKSEQSTMEDRFEEKFINISSINVESVHDALKKFIKSEIATAVRGRTKEMRRISDATVLRLQIMGVEVCGRLGEDEGVRIINDIRGTYEELLEQLDTQEEK